MVALRPGSVSFRIVARSAPVASRFSVAAQARLRDHGSHTEMRCNHDDSQKDSPKSERTHATWTKVKQDLSALRRQKSTPEGIARWRPELFARTAPHRTITPRRTLLHVGINLVSPMCAVAVAAPSKAARCPAVVPLVTGTAAVQC